MLDLSKTRGLIVAAKDDETDDVLLLVGAGNVPLLMLLMPKVLPLTPVLGEEETLLDEGGPPASDERTEPAGVDERPGNQPANENERHFE